MSRPEPPKPFTTDGCSLFPDGDYGDCCVEHDRIYWYGGNSAQRLAADRLLRECVARRGRPLLAWLMFVGVRIGGHAWWPTPWRWGYGWHYPYGGPDPDETR